MNVAHRTLVVVLVLLIATAAQAEGLSLKVLTGLESPRPRVRIAAVVAVQKSGDKKARRILEGMLGDTHAGVRAAAAAALGMLGAPEARPALEKLKADKSKLVQQAATRALVALDKASASSAAPDEAAPEPAKASSGPTGETVVFDVPAPQDLSGQAGEAQLKLLHEEVITALKTNAKVPVEIHRGDGKTGYGLWLRIRSVGQRAEGGVSFVDVRCEMTLVALPSRALRLSASATAGAGLEGELDKALREELMGDGIKACAPALASDVVDYAYSRRAR